MLFNSLEFAIFLPIVLFIYWIIGSERIKAQNIWLLGVSYLFYGWWDYRFLFLIAFSSGVDFLLAKRIEASTSTLNRKIYLGLSLFVNLGLLAYFKYANFFIDSFTEVFTFFGSHMDSSRLSIILPVGISFYTFQTLSYTLDVYRSKLKTTNSCIDFLAFVSFFPQLVAGPIERASNLLPQFKLKRELSKYNVQIGINLILLGLVKKMVLADSCAPIVNEVFSKFVHMSPLEVIFGIFAFSFQIYGDFSGYSDIAIGTASLFGFTLMTNFKRPYLSKNISEFWSRWHISLSTWFRDYLYIPLGGNKSFYIRNIIIVFGISGLWHGANWTFVIWGLYHAILLLIFVFVSRLFKQIKIPKIVSISLTFLCVSIGWVLFRIDSMDLFIEMVRILIVKKYSFNFIEFKHILVFAIITTVFIFEFILRRRTQLFFNETQKHLTFVIASIVLIVFLGAFSNPQEFIYFQF
ncbi:MAG: membrane-bound O-acyltransferase family protein [Bacteroidetes bacterium]|nr:MAG: membrane-bound O-acyltransferase family protein [Bacteroidota bacterium]